MCVKLSKGFENLSVIQAFPPVIATVAQDGFMEAVILSIVHGQRLQRLQEMTRSSGEEFYQLKQTYVTLILAPNHSSQWTVEDVVAAGDQ